MTPEEASRKAYEAGKRLPELEDIIATDGYFAYLYSSQIIKGRFKKAEKVIANHAYNNPTYSNVPYWYLSEIFDCKPPVDYAVKSSYALYIYAKNVIKGKLPTELHNRMLCFAIIETNAKHIKTYFKSKKYQ